jgi:hypothetical protein
VMLSVDGNVVSGRERCQWTGTLSVDGNVVSGRERCQWTGTMENRAERAKRYRKTAREYAGLASSGSRDIMSDVHGRLAERYARMAEDLERKEKLTNSMLALLSERE